MIREFSKNIVSINARQDDCAIECEQISKNIWHISGYKPRKMIKIEYEVYAFDFGIRTAYLDTKRGYFNATSLCLYIVGYEHLVHKINLTDIPCTWNIATSLRYEHNHYVAGSYAELIDSPFELGEFIRISFKVKEEITHYIILSGTIVPNFDSNRLVNDIIKICQTQIDLFGGSAPFVDYTFMLYLGGGIYTGLEHSNSTALMAPYYSLPGYHMQESNDDYLKLLSLISHEYFHLWNVKRIKPQVFKTYNLQDENYTNLLWWFEGITSYYDDLILYRAGLIDEKRYLQIVLDNINNVYKYTGVSKQSLNNSSLTSWVKYYRQDENSPNSIVSYYTKGALLGLCLDLMIRKQQHKKSLNNVLLGLYDKWLNDGCGIIENEIPCLIRKYAACDLSKEILLYTTTTAKLPLKELLKEFGVKLQSCRGSYSSKGIILGKTDKLPENNGLDLGIKVVKQDLGYIVKNVYANSPAEQAGLAANDLLLAIDNIKLTDLEKQLSLYTEKNQINIILFRNEQLITLSVKLKTQITDIYYLKIVNEKKLAKWL